MPIVGKSAPDFELVCTRVPGSARGRVSLTDYRDRWLVLVFYPRDFSQICPTELTAISTRIEEFHRRGAEVLGVSTDSLESHERWVSTPPALGGLGGIDFPLASDTDGTVSRAYGVYLDLQHAALRGLFIIDPNGVLQFQVVHHLSVGRRTDEILRVLAALETGGMCPEDWCVDCPTLDPTELLKPGSVLAHYRIKEQIGRGSFAVVYRAEDMLLERTVALKVFKPGALPTPDAVLAEARAAAALNDPNVCSIYSVEDSEGVAFIAMEYVAGRPLSRLLETGSLATKEAAKIGHQIAQGMAAAHSLGIVHGDLKPANVLVTDEGVVKITDFGLSRRHQLSLDKLETLPRGEATSGQIVGTLGYMSPEQTRGESLSAASDVFSLGVCLCEMLTGRPTFDGQSIAQVIDQIRAVEADRYANGLPDPFTGILRRVMVPDPRERLITMEQIAQLLAGP